MTRLEEVAHQIGGTRKQHPPLLLGGLDAERNRQVRLAGLNRAGEDQILWRRDPLAARERVDLRRTPSAAVKSKVSRVFTSEKRASWSRCRITDSCREACSALKASCR